MDAFPTWDTVHYALYGLAISVLYCIPFLGFAVIFSAYFSGTISYFLAASTVMFIITVVQLWNFASYPWVEFFLPSVVKESLLGLETYDLFTCVITLAAHSLIFYGLGWLVFSTRDL